MDHASLKSLKPSSVLFVCGMNSIRSPIAEALMHHLFPQIYVASAGIYRGERDAFACTILAEEGLSLNSHNPRGLEDLSDGFFDLIITLTPQAHQAVLQQMRSISVEVEYWPIANPALTNGSREQILDAYRNVRDVLKKRILQRFNENNVEHE